MATDASENTYVREGLHIRMCSLTHTVAKGHTYVRVFQRGRAGVFSRSLMEKTCLRPFFFRRIITSLQSKIRIFANGKKK